MVVVLGNFSITEKRLHQTSQSDAAGVFVNGRIRVVGWFGNLLLEAGNQLILEGYPLSASTSYSPKWSAPVTGKKFAVYLPNILIEPGGRAQARTRTTAMQQFSDHTVSAHGVKTYGHTDHDDSISLCQDLSLCHHHPSIR